MATSASEPHTFKMNQTYHYLFGPVPSRRLGRSLGIDVTPGNRCSFDCIFCQCGCTVTQTILRDEFVPFNEVCNELAEWLRKDGCADVITFAGSGEPTLYNRLGDLITFIKQQTDIPVMLLTNGSMLYDPVVRTEAALADRVKVSLSAWDDKSFQTINRPAPGITLRNTVEGITCFREEFNGELWLEVFLIAGKNDDPEQVRKIAAIAQAIRPDRIHLNTAVRPPAETDVHAVSQEKMSLLSNLFTPPAEGIASFKAATGKAPSEFSGEQLIELIHRHPSTAEQLAAVTGAAQQTVEAALAPLVEAGQLQKEIRNGSAYYK